MGQATQEILWRSTEQWIHSKNPQAQLLTRVGSGKQTYCRSESNNRFTITYGMKMVESNLDQTLALSWLSTKEIQQRGYYDGQLTLLNLLSHTVCHEYVHIIQNLKDWRYDGSVHNEEFYYLMDRLHASPLAYKVRGFLQRECSQAGISLEFRSISDLPTDPARTIKQDFSLGDTVKFKSKSGKVVTGRIKRVNQRTLSIQPDGDHRSYWRVSPHFVTKVT